MFVLVSCSVDCVGILKLRNADVEQRFGMRSLKKKSTRARMVFRVCIPKAAGGYQTLQVASTSISCSKLSHTNIFTATDHFSTMKIDVSAQPTGQPEICRMSMTSAPASGGVELFVIGKNFLKGSKVFFRERDGEEVMWSAEASYDSEFFHQVSVQAKLRVGCEVKQFTPVFILSRRRT